MALTIDNCHVCRQRAELMLYAADGRMVCGECRLTLDAGAVRNLSKNGDHASEESPRHVAPGPVIDTVEDLERQTYLKIIQKKADDSWVKKLIKEVIAKKILQYDWLRVISNPRWFSVLELRRFALDLDPRFEQETEYGEEPGDEEPPARVPEVMDEQKEKEDDES